MSLLEQDTTRKGQINKELANFEPDSELDIRNDKDYEVESIRNSAVFAKEAQSQLSDLYYLISYQNFPEEEDMWELALAVLYL